MGHPAIERLLEASIGLSVASIGSAAIARAVQERLSICRIDDPCTYLERIHAFPNELQALIEAVVVPETWFFRDRHAFAALARLAREEWMPAHPEGVLSALSLPCSTGEEPYSMAMALLDAGIPAGRFRVDAMDISARHLAHGEHAVYGKNSFRGGDLAFRDLHFDAMRDGYHVKEAVRRQVHFQQANLLAVDLLPGSGIYDVIFCRNVLIYFDRAAQDRALVVLNRLLHAKGVLFVAPAETGLAASHELVSTQEPLAFAFRKAGAVPRAPKQNAAAVVPLAARRVVAQRAPVRRVAPALPGGSEQSVLQPPVTRALGAAADLDEATRLADQGRFAEAAAHCEAHVRQFGPSATVFYLNGLVSDATGHASEAIVSYRKALYLDSNHYDTQIHLALLLEKQGDAAGAQVLRNRARRLEHNRADEKAPSHE